jgi:hypothetical protein
MFNADTRYSFMPQFLEAAAIFARRSAEIERTAGPDTTDLLRSEHRGCVVSVIMQCAAALETEIYEITVYGPGYHLGSNGIDHKARDFLLPCAEMIDHQDVGSRYELVLHLLKKPELSRSTQPFQDTALLVRLRNELVHYKSKWGNEMENNKFQHSLRQLNHPKPPFVSELSNFFPHLCLSAACAAWAVETTVAFLDAFYSRLGIAGRLDPYRSRLVVK